MLNFNKKVQILSLMCLLALPFTYVYANDYVLFTKRERCTEKKCKLAAAKKSKAPHRKKCKPAHVKKHKVVHAKPPQPVSVKTETPPPSAKKEELNIVTQAGSNCGDDIDVGDCPSLPAKRVDCTVMNPSDIVVSTCSEFSEKLKNCEAYTCQAPYALDPTVKTTWKIIKPVGDRCIVSSTTEDIGIKDDWDNPIPVTQKCEYDNRGKRGLMIRMRDIDNRYYHFSTCDNFEGVYNCTFKSRNLSIEDARSTPPE